MIIWRGAGVFIVLIVFGCSFRVAIDKQTGEEMIFSPSRPALFFIPVLYWGPILFIVAIVVFTLDFIK